MYRTRFRNKYLKNEINENKGKHTRTRIYCISSKTKIEYYSSLDIKNITDNKPFWKTVKPFLSDKITATQKIILTDSDKIVNNYDDTSRILNTFFSNIVSDLKTPDYNNWDPFAENIHDSILKAKIKDRNHPSMLTIGEVCKGNFQFSFMCVDKDEKKF